ncbi:MAG: YraN family protein [Dehalococcoidia bacterium]|nr:YraN family protein [Dehalococcoidia bacterium]
MTDRTRRLGEAGERLAADYLQNQGYRIVERNVRRREGEIDLIAVQDNGTLVFVEVKLRRSSRTGGAIQSISPAKEARLRTLAEAYIAEHPDLPEDLRIDVVAIDLTVSGEVGKLQHIQNAVEGN